MKLSRSISHGRVVWVLDHGTYKGRRRREYFDEDQEAEARAAMSKAKRDVDKVGRRWAQIPAEDRVEIVSLLEEMGRAGWTLRTAWDALKEAKAFAPGASPTLAVSITRLISAKTKAGLRASYVEDLEGYLRRFARGRETLPIGVITPVHLEEWFSSRGEKPATRRSNTGRLSSLFGFALRQGWVTADPCKSLETIRVDTKPPVILTPRRAARVLLWTLRNRPRALGFIALGLLCGLRPEEAQQTPWSAVDIERGTVTVDAAASKVRRRRIVHPLPSAVEWLRLAQKVGAELPLAHQPARRALRGLRRMLRLPRWPQDLLRHTAASYWLAEWQDAGRVAHELGNSAGILLRHYRELVSREDASRFWGIRPGKRIRTK